MKKRLLAIAFAMLFCLSACAPKAEAPITASPAPGAATPAEPPDGSAVMRLKVAKLYDGSFLGMGVGEKASSAGLYFVSTSGLGPSEPLAPGMIVDVSYSGEIQETFPATLASPAGIALVETEGDLVGFYTGVLEELYGDDAALNTDISIIAFDLSETANLTEAERAALTYIMSGAHGAEAVSGTFEELCDQGYIDEESLYFPDGILFSINNVVTESETRFTFSASKWRSGLGAIGMSECKAEFENGAWVYTRGGMWVS